MSDKQQPITWNSEGRVVPLTDEEAARQANAERQVDDGSSKSSYSLSAEESRKLKKIYKSGLAPSVELGFIGQLWLYSRIPLALVVLALILSQFRGCGRG